MKDILARVVTESGCTFLCAQGSSSFSNFSDATCVILTVVLFLARYGRGVSDVALNLYSFFPFVT